MKTDSREFKEWLKRGSNDAWNNELTTANESYLETEDMMGRLPMTKETTVIDLVGAEQLELMNRLGKIKHQRIFKPSRKNTVVDHWTWAPGRGVKVIYKDHTTMNSE